MSEAGNAAALATGYLRGYPWGKEPFIETYEGPNHENFNCLLGKR